MAIRLREVSNISSVVIKRSSRRRRSKQRRAALPADEKCPLIATWMPVDLTHPTGVHGDDGSSEVLGDGEGVRIDDLHGAACDLMCWLLGKVVGVALGQGDLTGCCSDVLLGDVLWSRCSGENIEFVFRDVVERLDGDAEVFGNDFFLLVVSILVRVGGR